MIVLISILIIFLILIISSIIAHKLEIDEYAAPSIALMAIFVIFIFFIVLGFYEDARIKANYLNKKYDLNVTQEECFYNFDLIKKTNQLIP